MIITISATLNEEQINILANQKWYSNTTTELVEWEIININNTQSKEDFIRKVYESIIINDATREYISYSIRQKEESRIVEENAIREQVAQFITSNIE